MNGDYFRLRLTIVCVTVFTCQWCFFWSRGLTLLSCEWGNLLLLYYVVVMLLFSFNAFNRSDDWRNSFPKALRFYYKLGVFAGWLNAAYNWIVITTIGGGKPARSYYLLLGLRGSKEHRLNWPCNSRSGMRG